MKNRKDYQSIEFNFEGGVDGMSEKMLTDHLALYDGYVKKSNEIQTNTDQADKSSANQSYSEFGELKRQETFSVNGMKLHELYFSQIDGDGEPKGIFKEMIEKDFGSVEEWKAEMVATGVASRGWAVCAYDFKDDRLHIYGQDAHNIGAVWGCAPLVALDVYEHAYFIDYGKTRGEYIEAFFKNLNWDFVSKMIEKWGIDKMHRGSE